jgi:cytochrome c nitrite reductase small subunit
MSWTSRATLALTFVIGAIALVGIALPLTDQPTFCAGCHTIAPSYESWAKSSHKDVTCVACHVRPGVQGWLSDKVVAGVRDTVIYVFGTPTEAHNLKATVDSGVCLSCHRHILRMSETAPRDLPSPVKEVGLVMSHRLHMEAFRVRGQEEGCTTCHAGVVHDEPIKGYPTVIPRGHVSGRRSMAGKHWTGNAGPAISRKRSAAPCYSTDRVLKSRPTAGSMKRK